MNTDLLLALIPISSGLMQFHFLKIDREVRATSCGPKKLWLLGFAITSLAWFFIEKTLGITLYIILQLLHFKFVWQTITPAADVGSHLHSNDQLDSKK
jgi:hypothetical protein